MTQGKLPTNSRPDLNTLEKAHRAVGFVKRWHTEQMLREQRLDSHIFGMIRIYYHIWGVPNQDILPAILFHDFEELFLGDLPYWTHRYHGLRKAYGDAEKHMLATLPGFPMLIETDNYRIKIVDKIDALETMLDEVWFGNESLRLPMGRLYDVLLEEMSPISVEDVGLVERYLDKVGFTHRFNLAMDGVHR